MEAAKNRSSTTTTGKRKVRASKAAPQRQRKPLADCTNAPPSQSSTTSSPIPKPPARAAESADEVAATGSVYTRRKCRSGRSSSLVSRLVENEGETLFKYSTEEDAPPPSMLSKSLTEPPRKKRLQRGSDDVLPRDFITKQKAYFAEIDAFDLPVEVASSESDELD